MQYVIVEKTSIHGLEERVNELIELGLKPLGGIAIHLTPLNINNSRYYQAMVDENE